MHDLRERQLLPLFLFLGRASRTRAFSLHIFTPSRFPISARKYANRSDLLTPKPIHFNSLRNAQNMGTG
jgi:hypothetical protein